MAHVPQKNVNLPEGNGKKMMFVVVNRVLNKVDGQSDGNWMDRTGEI